jgi:hypothetical protein
MDRFTKLLGCFKTQPKSSSNDFEDEIFNISRKLNIIILPVDGNKSKLYNESIHGIDEEDTWNVFVVNALKTYIVKNINEELILDTKSTDAIFKLFDVLWNYTLSGKQLQYYLFWKEKTFFLYTFPLQSLKKNNFIGGILFMKPISRKKNITHTTISGKLLPVRYSVDSSNNKINAEVFTNYIEINDENSETFNDYISNLK